MKDREAARWAVAEFLCERDGYDAINVNVAVRLIDADRLLDLLEYPHGGGFSGAI